MVIIKAHLLERGLIAIDVYHAVLAGLAGGLLADNDRSVGLTWCVTRIAKTEKFKSLSEVLTQFSTTVNDTVHELQQTVVDGLKEAAADGKLTQDEIAWLNAQLLTMVKAKMAQPAIDLLNAAKVDINALITGMAEAAIKNMKKDEALPLLGEIVTEESKI